MDKSRLLKAKLPAATQLIYSPGNPRRALQLAATAGKPTRISHICSQIPSVGCEDWTVLSFEASILAPGLAILPATAATLLAVAGAVVTGCGRVFT